MGSNLTEKQEILLCRLFDGDLGLINRHRANRLVKRCCAAQDFLRNLESISSAVSSSPEHSRSLPPCDLWDRISQRIVAEERASLFLGTRTQQTIGSKEKNQHNWYSFFSTQALLGGVSGAATTALVLLVVSSYKTAPSPTDMLASTINGGNPSHQFTQAALSNNGFENSRTSVGSPFSATSSSSRPLLLQDRGNSVMEVDWMRGDGPLRVIQNPSEKSTIIWIKRQNQSRKPLLRNKTYRDSYGNPTMGRNSLPQLVVTNAPLYNRDGFSSPQR
jgi:hypothetical protein